MGGEIVVKLLEEPSVDQVSRFRVDGEESRSLVRFIRRDAFKSAKANLTQTYVLKRGGDKCVIAYASIMCAEVALEQSYAIADKVGADRYDFQPAIRIARLAVDEEYRGIGLGRLLVRFIISVVQESIQPITGCRFVVLDAKPGSVAFYESLGFRLLDTQQNRAKNTPLMFLDLQDLR
jgi:predicted N-acetyltransferase YhbS